MKFIKILLLTNIVIILLFIITGTILYIGQSFINWELTNYIDYINPCDNNQELRSFYTYTLFLSFMYTCIHFIMNSDDNNN